MRHVPLWLLLVALQSPAELQLNLVGAPLPPERPDAKALKDGCGVGSSDSVGAPKPFKVTLADTDRLMYLVGETMTFTVIIENTCTAPLVLGISRDPDVAPKIMMPCRVVPPGIHFNVALVAATPKGLGAFISSGPGFYGSLGAPGTTAVLAPGDRARVQLPGLVMPGPGMDPELTADPQPERIKAFAIIDGNTTQSEYSENSLEIELKRRQ